MKLSQMWIAAVLMALMLIVPGNAFAADDWNLDDFDPEKVDPFMGDYQGEYKILGQEPVYAEAKVVARAGDKYTVHIASQPIKGDIWGIHMELTGNAEGDAVLLSNDSAGGIPWKGHITDGQIFVVTPYYNGEFEFKKVLKTSPTAGAAPPEGAIVLLPFEEGKAPDMSEWTNETWIPIPDGSMMVNEGYNHTKRSFGDMHLHIEFATPYQPDAWGQQRGNSGVYVQERYEVQILDSFGHFLQSGDCGSIYTVAVPLQNPSFPPHSWQTYDIVFRSPRLDADGNQIEDPWLTVDHNGVRIHERQEVGGPTPGGGGEPVLKAPFKLQDHGNPMRYRNIWVVELEDAAKH